jgi:hypothetical protein
VIVAHSRPVAPFRFQFRKLRIWPAAFIGKFLAVDRPDMWRICIEVRSSDPKLFAGGSIHFHEFSRELHRCATSASVKQRRTQHEHMFSALRSNSDIA